MHLKLWFTVVFHWSYLANDLDLFPTGRWWVAKYWMLALEESASALVHLALREGRWTLCSACSPIFESVAPVDKSWKFLRMVLRTLEQSVTKLATKVLWQDFEQRALPQCMNRNVWLDGAMNNVSWNFRSALDGKEFVQMLANTCVYIVLSA